MRYAYHLLNTSTPTKGLPQGVVFDIRRGDERRVYDIAFTCQHRIVDNPDDLRIMFPTCLGRCKEVYNVSLGNPTPFLPLPSTQFIRAKYGFIAVISSSYIYIHIHIISAAVFIQMRISRSPGSAQRSIIFSRKEYELVTVVSNQIPNSPGRTAPGHSAFISCKMSW